METVLVKQPETLWTVQEAATFLGVTDAYVRQLLLAGMLSGYKPSKNLWLIPASVVKEYALNRRPPGRPPKEAN